MCRQVGRAGHAGVCLGHGVTVDISITRSVGFAAACSLFPLQDWHGCGKTLVSSPAHTPQYGAVVRWVRPVVSEEFLGIRVCFEERWLEAACAPSAPQLHIFSPWFFLFSTTHFECVSPSVVDILDGIKGNRLGRVVGFIRIRGSFPRQGWDLHVHPISAPQA